MRKHPFLTGFGIIFISGIFFILCMMGLARTGFLDDLGVGGGDKIVVLDIEGVIVKSRPVIEKLIQYKNSERVKAVVLRIDSPGGGVCPSQEIYEEVIKLREKKIVVVSMGSVAASGGYYIACAAHKVFANPGTITGSIGVIIEFSNVEELLNKIGMKSVVIKSGEYKDILSPTRKMTEADRILLQGVIDNIQGQFIDAIALGRELPREKVVGIADGRLFSGEQAKMSGLIDELGNLQDAIKAASEMAGIEGEPDVVYPEKKRLSIWEYFMEASMSKISSFVSDNLFKVSYRLNVL